MKSKLYSVLVVLLVICFAIPVGAAPYDPNTFVYVGIGEPDTFDPAYAYDTGSGEIIHQLYDNLFGYADGDIDEIVPLLATAVPSVENGLLSADGKTMRVPIRKGVKFHNGAELTPEDVEYTFERAMLADPAGGPVWMFLEPLLGVQTMKDVIVLAGGPETFENITDVDPAVLRKAYDLVDASVEVDGDDVVFHLAAPYPPFIQIMSKGGSWSSILNKDWMIANGAWDGQPDTWAKWYDQAKEDMTLYEQANGTGPFKLQAWDRSGGQVVLKRFDEYWQGPASLETVFVKYIDEATTRKLMLQAGDADAVYVSTDLLDQLRGVDGITIIEDLPYIGNTTLLYNYSIPVQGNEDIVGSGKLDGKGIPSNFFADINIRKAFNYSFDYDSYLEYVAMGAGTMPVGLAPQVLPYVNPDQEWYSYDLDKATEYFKKAFDGEVWEKGFELTLLYNTGNEQRKTAAEILEANIEMINPKFKVNVAGMQWATYLTKLRASSLPVFFMGWAMDFPDVHNFYVPYMHSAGAFAGYCGQGLVDLAKDQFDDLIGQAINATDPAEREALYYKLQDLSFEYAVAMPYIDSTQHRVHRDWVEGFVYCPAYSCQYDFYTISKAQR
ncbi:MAG: ABC transporter substrate-binding protein [Firmicutes bacterium]|nr:ABC transporter substrate-binding protein [Bacillota bacterium]